MELGGGGRERGREGERGWEVVFKIYRFILQFHLNMMMEHEREERLIESVVVIDIDPALALFRPSQQKWVSSLELLTETPKEPRPNYKTITLGHSLLLQVGYCEKNRPPIYEVDFVTQPSHEWIPIKSPASFSDRYGALSLCYKAGDNPVCEPLTDLEILITERKRVNEEKEVFILPPGYKIVNNNPAAHNYLIYKRMRSPLEQTFKASLLEKYPEESLRITLTMLPLFCFPEGIHLAKQLKGFINFNFMLTTEMGDRVYCNCLTFKENMEDTMKEQLGLPIADRIYYEKAICLVSMSRYTDEFAECLKHLYRLSMSKNDVPFHRVVSSFVQGLLLPRELGINGMSYSYGGSNINFETNPSYPIISERSIYCIFKFLPLSAIISIFEAILLEKKIIFVSQSKTVLGYAVEAFLAFIFPFRWEHVIIPILPSTLREYITAPVPLIVGISPSMLDRNIESDSVIIQLDNGTILNDEDLPPLPDKLQKQLRRKLEPFELYDEDEVKEYLENPESTYIFKMQEVQHPEFQGNVIRDCFYEFLLTLMKNYKKFWKVSKYKDSKETSSIGLTQPQLLNDIFKLQDFLSDLGMTKVGSFGYKLTQGTIFTSFIERRHQYQEDPELTFFDSCIDKKKSKKEMRLLEKPTNIRYNVVKHPEPEQVKAVFDYERFPSILPKEAIREAEITIQLDSVNEEQLQLLEEFLESQLKLNKKLFTESQGSDLDYKIECLLLERFRFRYQEYCEQMGNMKNQTIRSSLVPKHRNLREIFDKLQLFEKLYVEQNVFIENFFLSWPYQEEGGEKVRELSKQEYLRKYLKADVFPEDDLLCVFEDYYGFKYRNYEIIILGNCKITFLDNRELKSCQPSLDNLRNSKKKVKYAYEIYFEHFKLKNFVNKILPAQGFSFFNFALDKLQQQNEYVWTLETLIDWRRHLERDLGKP